MPEGVFITDRGKPGHVLLSFEADQRLAGKHRSLVDALSMPGLSDIDVEIQQLRDLRRDGQKPGLF